MYLQKIKNGYLDISLYMNKGYFEVIKLEVKKVGKIPNVIIKHRRTRSKFFLKIGRLEEISRCYL